MSAPMELKLRCWMWSVGGLCSSPWTGRRLLWFLLQLICSPEFQLPRRGFSPFRWSMTSLAMQSWEGVGEDDVDFIDCEGRGVGNELFVKVLADDRGASQCVSAYRRTWWHWWRRISRSGRESSTTLISDRCRSASTAFVGFRVSAGQHPVRWTTDHRRALFTPLCGWFRSNLGRTDGRGLIPCHQWQLGAHETDTYGG